MVYKYDSSQEAVAFVAGCLAEQFSDAHAELIYFSRNHAQTVACSLEKVAGVLGKMCRRWPRITVEYTPNNKYGLVAELQCHGEKTEGHTTLWRLRKDYSRPRVVIMLTKIDGQDVLIGGKDKMPEEQEGVLTTPKEEV